MDIDTIVPVLFSKTPILQRILATRPADLISYLPLGDPSGTTAKDYSQTAADGAYAGIFTLNQPGIGDGSPSVNFGGGWVSLAANLATLDTPFDGAEGSLFCWAKVSTVGVWTDTAFHVVSALGADVNNRILIYKPNTNNTLTWLYNAGGISLTNVMTTSTLDWFSMGITWSKSKDRVRRYFNGVQQGADITGLGVWVGALNSSWSAIGSQSSLAASSTWSGFLGHNATWKIELAPAEVARL